MSSSANVPMFVSSSVPSKIILSNFGCVESAITIADIDEKSTLLFNHLSAKARKRGGNAIVNLSMRRHILGPTHGGLHLRMLVCAYGDVVLLGDAQTDYSMPLPPASFK